MSSNQLLPYTTVFMVVFSHTSSWLSGLPINGRWLQIDSTRSLVRKYAGRARILERYLEKEPTFFEMDILLSLRMTIRLSPQRAALLAPSNASPLVKAPSPMTAMT